MAALVDSQNRKLEYLRLSVVDSCNMHCFYCSPGSACKPRGIKDLLRCDELVQIVNGAVNVGICKIRLTGGEPLLRKDIVSLVKEIAAIPGIKDLSLTTNGSLLSGLAAPLAEAGLKRVNISLDSLDCNKFNEITRGGELQATLDGIDAAFSAGLHPIKINMVVIKGINDLEIEKFSSLTFDRDIHIRFIEYMPLLGQDEFWRKHFLPASVIMERCGILAPILPVPEEDSYGPARNYRYQDAKGQLGFITPISRHFCQKCNRLRLTSAGKLKPCLFSKEEVDLLPALRKNEDLSPYFCEAARLKPPFNKTSRAAQGAMLGPQGMADIGG